MAWAVISTKRFGPAYPFLTSDAPGEWMGPVSGVKTTPLRKDLQDGSLASVKDSRAGHANTPWHRGYGDLGPKSEA